MILEKHPLTLIEVQEIVKDLDEKQQLKAYLKKFTKLKKGKTEELKKEIKNLDNVKINSQHLVKVCDFLPTEPEEVNKVFNDVTLTEEEIQKIIEIVKKYTK